MHSATQLDSVTGLHLSRDRLEAALGAPVESLAHKLVLEPGCGAGRFTELLVGAGAIVHAFDLSRAVDANRRNIGQPPNYSIAQADILEIPYPDESFDTIVCLGVLQYTPSPEASLRSLWRVLKPGGLLVVDQYAWSISRATKLDALLRQVLIRIDPDVAKQVSDTLVRWLFPLHWTIRRWPIVQALLSRISPVSTYMRTVPQLSKGQHYDLAMLDTYNHLTGHFQHITTPSRMSKVLRALGAVNIDVEAGGNGVVGRATKPEAGATSLA